MKRPVITVTGPEKGGFSRFFIALAVLLSGGTPRRVVPSDAEGREKPFDGLLISGGNDIDPALYGEEAADPADSIDPLRDELEYDLLARAVADGKPVLGICRGYQLINVYFGGTLTREIGPLYGRHRYSPLPWKRIRIQKGSFLHQITDREHISINTLHHQAVARVAPGFRPAAWDRQKTIQAIENGDGAVFGVQWHPEYLLYLPVHFRLIKSLVEKSRKEPA